MNLNLDAKDLVIDILERSTCAVMVGAVIEDNHGIFSWGWNHSGDGYGEHAEMHALGRANPKRLLGAVIYVAAKRFRNGRIVFSRPCGECMPQLKGMDVWWRGKDGKWYR